MVTNFEAASLEVRLFFWWDNLAPGSAVTMQEMMNAMGTTEPQVIRNALVRLRRGLVRDPSSATENLVPRPIRYDQASGRYYDLSKVPPDLVASEIPGRVLTRQISELLHRAFTLEQALGEHGLALSAQQYLQNPDIRHLISQLPTETMWHVVDTVERLARARHLLAIEQATRPQGLPPAESAQDE